MHIPNLIFLANCFFHYIRSRCWSPIVIGSQGSCHRVPYLLQEIISVGISQYSSFLLGLRPFLNYFALEPVFECTQSPNSFSYPTDARIFTIHDPEQCQFLHEIPFVEERQSAISTTYCRIILPSLSRVRFASISVSRSPFMPLHVVN